MIRTVIEFNKADPQYYRKFVVQTFAGFYGQYVTAVHEQHQLTEYNEHMNKWQFSCKPPLILTQEFRQDHSDLAVMPPEDTRIFVGQRHLAICLEVLDKESISHHNLRRQS